MLEQNIYQNRVIEWTEFFEIFREQNNSFIKTLIELYPNLTMMEFKLCCMLRAGFTNREISTFTKRTIRSVETARYRLRKKFPISSNEDLGLFLMKI
jgi:DNA-binding CsgD family transcriptional regulator